MANNNSKSAVEQLAGLVLFGVKFWGFIILLGIVGVLYYLTHGGDMYSKENIRRFEQERQSQQQPTPQSYTPYTPTSTGNVTRPDPGPPPPFNAPAPPR